ncbi:DUF4082 domain-containing protein [Nocardioides sp. CER19]|uniref:DUF4082 domain-containing protein n=1 Tax=Nocardioides sp. CER19 TaxID=3038538 RepID=UPI00244AF22E|nr:DUF4082 domain-containing protein [Nocardioides sp. CER19]MDH2414196.1 DUF4082 domain-containing protein [Nocardioides sp. CER19]
MRPIMLTSCVARFVAALGSAAVLAVAGLAVTVVAPAPASGRVTTTGLWPTSFRAHQTAADCGRWRLDEHGFCVADDTRNGLELGVRFRTSRVLRVTGVRIYRFDTATLRASLWSSSGTLLARGTFAPGPANAWQDMTFPAPVTIVPGRTYVASYFSPNTRYAFRYGYFARSGRTVGPVTALRSTDREPNGVHCYEDAICGSFPVRGYRSSTYWVTPLWATPPAAGVATSPGPRVVRVQPGHALAKVTTTVQVTFSEPLRSSTLTTATVRLVGPDGRVATRLSYAAAQRRVVLDPRRRLRPGTRYRVEVSTRVRDTAGRRLDQRPAMTGLQRGVWRFRTR